MSDLSAGRRRAPSELTLIRHAESLGNVADRVAREKSAHHLDLAYRDADTPLSDVGRAQAVAVSRWAAQLEETQRPSVVLSSPYQRAHQSARLSVEPLGLGDHIVVDERLRERDLGILDRMTGDGIRQNYPQEAARRADVGKFYYRPPGGESWTDVVARVRSVLADIRGEYDGERVWIFSHQAVIMSFRFVLEGLDEPTLLAIDAQTPMDNCSMTRYARSEAGALTLVHYADTAAVERYGAPRTHEESHGSGAHA